jgi:transcriptional repressor NrdR
MHCPFCRHDDTRVLDSRVADDGGAIRRRRTCSQCARRFSTVEQMQLVVVKRSGATEPFNREKAVAGVRKASKGRPVTQDQLARLGQQVEESLRSAGWAEVPAHEVGMAILEPLSELDEVAYLRFASVYRSFESAHDFEAAIAQLRARASDHDEAEPEPALEPRPPVALAT